MSHADRPSAAVGVAAPVGRGWRGRRGRVVALVAVYLVLLGLSHGVIEVRGRAGERATFEPDDERAALVELAAMDDAGPIAGERMRMAYLEWRPAAGASGRPAVVMLHGSPGRGNNFDRLAPLLAGRGYRVIAPDMPGFGDSSIDVPRYSTLAHAHAVRAMLEELGIGRAHLVGWSMGGGVAFHLVDMEPERYASLTLLAAVGDMSMEGSGSYAFEKFKYGVGYALLVGGPELVPHFGLLGTRETPAGQFRHSFIRNFLDTDQREYTEIMRRLRTPTMILHGRDDFLVPDYAAELSHDMIESSRLVMLDASHFLPFLQAEETAEHLAPFLSRHDGAAGGAGLAPVRQSVDLAPPAGVLLDEVIDELVPAFRAVPWWALVIVVALASAALPTGATLGAAVLSSALLMDFGVAIAGLLVGLGARRAPAFGATARPTSPWKRIARVVVGAPVMFIAASVLSSAVVLPAGEHVGLVGLAGGFVLSALVLRALPLLPTREGRRELRVKLRRARHHEFWPGWVFYLPMWPCWVWLAVRARHPLAFTCCNAAIQPGGGVIGESKQEIIEALRAHPGSRDSVLAAALVAEGPEPEERARRAMELIETNPDLGGFPVILKPDSGFRGFDVKLARGESDVVEYFRRQTRPVQVQAYHPGPREVGVVWARRRGTITGAGRDGASGCGGGLAGSIYSITRKEFPFVVGDGDRTVRELVLAHPRHRLQAGVFLARLGERIDRVPAPGESVRLAEAGNHCQGTLFRDGSDLITAELEARIDELARRMGWAGDGNGDDTHQLDYGRFDIRYGSDEDLRAGRIDGVIELNGVTGEPTALYDPSRSFFWAYRLLLGQWRRVYELGAARRDAGARPMGVVEVLVSLRGFYKGRPGSAVAD